MARPRKEVKESVEELEEGTKKPELTPTELAANRIAAKRAALEKMEADTFAKAAELAEKYSKSKNAPIFLPYKDRDGKIVPSLLLGSFTGEKRDDSGELILSEGREIIQETKLSVWVFSNSSEPHRAVYKAPENF